MFKKVKELLDNGSISEEIAKGLDAEIQTELTTLREESKSHRLKFEELQTTFNEVSESKKSLEAQVTGLDEKILKAKEDGKKELVKDLEKEKLEKSELVEKFNKMESNNKSLKIENALAKELSKYDVVDAELLSESFQHKLNVFDDGIKFNETTTLEDGMKQYFEKKPHLLKAQGGNGSGSGNENNGYSPDSLTAQKLAKLNK